MRLLPMLGHQEHSTGGEGRSSTRPRLSKERKHLDVPRVLSYFPLLLGPSLARVRVFQAPLLLLS